MTTQRKRNQDFSGPVSSYHFEEVRAEADALVRNLHFFDSIQASGKGKKKAIHARMSRIYRRLEELEKSYPQLAPLTAEGNKFYTAEVLEHV